jgi:UDP-3-O-[3-hydroxymyristoyl] glucosamine N-acyltransferase
MSQNALKAQELARRLGGTLRHCPPDRILATVKPLGEAGEDALSFLANPRYLAQAMDSKAGVILVDPKVDLGERPQIVMDNPYWGFAQAIGWLHPEPEAEWCDRPVHPTAVLGEGTRVGPGATIGARTVLGRDNRIHPGVHLAEDCVLGDGCELFPGVVLYRGTRLGSRVRIHGNTVLGSDGFGYVPVAGRHEKIPQVGWVEVGDDVEIGACTTVDRGVLGPTRILQGTKIDNAAQIAHNVVIGEHCIIVSQAGISGSTTFGDHCTVGGKAGFAGHLHIGSRSIVAANSMVAKDLPEGSFVSGYLARPHRQWMETQAALNRLPAILKDLRRKA